MKYKFTKIDEDTTELSYKDKKFLIKRDVDLLKRMQEAIPRARILMNAELSKMGMTKKDLVIERHEGNKTIYDNSNIMDAEEQYQAIATMEVFDNILKKYTQMSFIELMEDVGFNPNQESEENNKFALELTNCLNGKNDEFPSKPQIEAV